MISQYFINFVLKSSANETKTKVADLNVTMICREPPILLVFVIFYGISLVVLLFGFNATHRSSDPAVNPASSGCVSAGCRGV